jgi:hypothetical protein
VSLLLTTHDIESVRSMCSTALWLDGGQVRGQGDPRDVTAAYMRHLFGGDGTPRVAVQAPRHSEPPRPLRTPHRPLVDLLARHDLDRWGEGSVRLTGFWLGVAGAPSDNSIYHNGDRLRLEVEFRAEQDLDGAGLAVAFSIRNTKALNIITQSTFEAGETLPDVARGARLRLAFEFDNILPRGEYGLVLAVEVATPEGRRYLDFVENALVFHVAATQRALAVVLPAVTIEIEHPSVGHPET